MSRMEYNKGRMKVYSTKELETLAKQIITDEDSESYKNKVECLLDNPYHYLGDDFCVIGDDLYGVEFEVRDSELDYINNLEIDSDGILHFETYHYNGGGNWTELVESKLKKLKESV